MDLDAKTVLAHLNSMGFRNISAEQLKSFTKDLKKIVKYDARLLNKDISSKQESERFRTATVASSAKTQTKFQREMDQDKENDHQIQGHPPPRPRSAKTTDTGNKMWIRTRMEHRKSKNEDAVQLYQKYKKEWERFKQRMPGENDHTNLRWQVRTKMLGES